MQAEYATAGRGRRASPDSGQESSMTQTQLPPPPPPPGLSPPPPGLPPAPWKTCRHCSAQAQTLVRACPHCGKSYKKQQTLLKSLLALMLTGVAFMVGCAALISRASDEATDTTGGYSS